MIASFIRIDVIRKLTLYMLNNIFYKSLLLNIRAPDYCLRILDVLLLILIKNNNYNNNNNDINDQS